MKKPKFFNCYLDNEVLLNHLSDEQAGKLWKSLFAFAKSLINKLKEDYNVIVSGRSVMKIYPECDYHFFVIADLEERVRRKCMQYNNKETIDEIRENITKRDELQKQAGFYEYSPITIEVDVTNCKSVEESTKLVFDKIKLPLLAN